MRSDDLYLSRKNLRAYPGTVRNTTEWDEKYKIRTTVERSINQVKDSFVLADKIYHHEYIQSLKPL